MKRFYLITIIAIVVTTSIASHLLAIGALGPTTPIRGLRAHAAALLQWSRAYAGRWIAAAMTRRASLPGGDAR